MADIANTIERGTVAAERAKVTLECLIDRRPTIKPIRHLRI